MFHYGKAAKPRAAVDAYLSAGHLMVEGQTRTLQASQQMDALWSPHHHFNKSVINLIVSELFQLCCKCI